MTRKAPDYHFCGQALSAVECQLIQDLTLRYGRLSRHVLAQTVCELLGWQRANGNLKAAECRILLEQMQDKGWIHLPALRTGRPLGRKTGTSTIPVPISEMPTALAALQPIRLQRVETPAQRQLWRDLIAQHHYLGHNVPFGAHLRYLIQGTPHPDTLHSPWVLGCLQFSSSAWRMRARDAWIGWDDATRAKRLQQVICNSRFLILPQVQVKNLASHVLALALRTVTRDWEAAYGLRPYLVETLVDTTRFTGHCYQAANWIDVGLTTGRGRQDRQHALHDAHPKRIFLYPLTPNAQQKLRQST